MRHLLGFLVGFASLATCVHPWAQAYFDVRNYPGPWPLDAPVYDWTGGLLWGPDWRAELYGGVTTDSLSPAVRLYTYIRSPLPFFLPGYFGYTGGHDVVVLSVPGGGYAWLQVKVWNVQLGATYEETVARRLGGYGQSSLFYAQGSNPLADPPQAPYPLIGLTSFSVSQPVPEPAVGWLAVAGLAGLALIRRRARGRIRPHLRTSGQALASMTFTC
jgi:MYXO-CTERM domain-containing protein